MSATLEQQLEGISNVLVLGSMLEPDTQAVHERLVSRGTEDGIHLLELTFHSPERCLQMCACPPERREELVIISFSESASRAETLPEGVRAITVSPGDLTGIGMRLSEYLSEWDGTDAKTVVCFDSITELFQYTETKPLYRFLRVLTRRIEYTGGFAHFHMDPSAHEEQTLSIFRSMFDAVIDTTVPDGEFRVYTR